MPQLKPIRGTQLNRSHPLSRGLVCCLPFNEGSGRIVNDLSGNGNMGTFENSPIWVSGKFGPAIEFASASKQYINVGNISSFLFSGPFTVAHWLYHTSESTDFVWGKQAAGSDGAEFLVRYPEARYEFRIDLSVGADIVTPDGEAVVNQWQFVAVTRDSSNITKIYVDGVERVSETIAKDGSTTASMFIGDSTSLPGVISWDGKIDDPIICKRALTAAEMTLLYREPVCVIEERRRPELWTAPAVAARVRSRCGFKPITGADRLRGLRRYALY